MAAANKKMAILLVFKYLAENTDRNCGVTNKEISDYLSSEYGISQEDKTISSHIKIIGEVMKDKYEIIINKKGNVNYYSLVSDSFNISDAILIVTSLYGNRSISQKDADSISEKMLKGCSKAERKKILDSVIKRKEVRSQNDIYEDDGYMPLRDITDAIVERSKILIDYTEYPLSAPYEIKHFNISPYRILSRSGNLYLLAKCDEHESSISKFRVDRIVGVEKGSGEYIYQSNKFTAEDEARINKSMAIGQTITAVLEFNSRVEKVVYDRYGRDAEILSTKNGITRISVEEVLSDSLLSWIFMLGENIKIIGCKELKDRFREKVEKISQFIKE